MPAVALAAFPAFYDSLGNPLSGGKLYTYAAGTSTPLASYTDRGGLTANANPIILDSAGRCRCWLAINVPYKLRLFTSADVQIGTDADDYYAGADPAQLIAAGIVPATGGTYTGPVVFSNEVEFTGTAAQKLETLDSLGISSVQNANLWVNSDLGIWQRGAASVADAAYGFDRTVVLAQSGSVTLSQLTAPTDGIPYAMRMTQPDASPKRMGSVQIVEAANCVAYRGSQLVFVPKIRMSATTTVYAALVAWTSTADAPTRDLINDWTSTTYTAGNFFVANTSTIVAGAVSCAANEWTDVWVSSASGGGVVAPSTMNNLYMVFWTDQTVAQNVTMDVSTIRAGRGTVPPLWTPPNRAAELLRCQRYLNRLDGANLFGMGQATSTTAITLPVIFSPPMRTTPTLAGFNLVTALTAAGSAIVANTGALGIASEKSATVNMTMASASFVAGNASLVIGSAAGSVLSFSAEL